MAVAKLKAIETGMTVCIEDRQQVDNGPYHECHKMLVKHRIFHECHKILIERRIRTLNGHWFCLNKLAAVHVGTFEKYGHFDGQFSCNYKQAPSGSCVSMHIPEHRLLDTGVGLSILYEGLPRTTQMSPSREGC